MKRISLLLILLFAQYLFAPTFAASKDKEARKVLDATYARISKAGGISLQFTATTLMGKTPQGSTKGKMDITGKKFWVKTSDMQTWFDGKTQWTMMEGDDEVSLTEPNGAELQALNPYAFLSIYKQGFNYSMKKGKLSNNKNGYKISLTADNAKSDIREIFLEVDNQYTPVRVSMRQGKNQWVRIVVESFKTGQKFGNNHFSFPKSKYPQTEIIDLR